MRTAIADIACITEVGEKAKLPALQTSVSAPKKSGRQKNKKKGVPKWKSRSTEKLSLRQFIFSACACVVAVGIYFLLKPYVGTETVSWMCILGAAPFAALGFIKYNGMTAEKFIYAWIKSEFLMPKKLTFRSTNTYYELLKPSIETKVKEAMKPND